MTQPSDEFLALQAALAGEYSLQRELGRGGMGIVYLARDVQLDRDVAIKVLPSHLARTEASRERFLREARTAAGLSHPHIVPIHRVGESAGFVYFVMSYVEGETLGERLRREGPLPAADATRVLREVAWALAYAHGRGIVHRDVKPDNILLEAGTGRALVTDFGIAHGGANAEIATDRGKIMGTAHFMSPEQAAGEPIDGRSDLYSLGVVGYPAGKWETSLRDFESARAARAAGDGSAAERARRGAGAPSLRWASRSTAASRSNPPSGSRMARRSPPRSRPRVDARPALPPTLRGWLGARNPLLVPYMAWSAGFSVLTLGNVYANATGNRRLVVVGRRDAGLDRRRAASPRRRVPPVSGTPPVPGGTYAGRPALGARDRAARARRERGAGS
jgi:serine/threonine-protein kinase